MPKNEYIIPLKKAYDNKPRTRRANVAIRMIYDFLRKHLRKERSDIILSNELNAFIWKDSIQKPPRKISVSLTTKDDKTYVFLKDSAEFKDFSKPKAKPKVEKKAEAKKETTTTKAEVKTDEKAETTKPITETKEVKEESKQEAKETVEEVKVEETPKEVVKEEATKEESK